MYRIVSKNYETSFNIVAQTFAVDLDFDCCTVGSVKHSSCVGEYMRASLNRLLNSPNIPLREYMVRISYQNSIY